MKQKRHPSLRGIILISFQQMHALNHHEKHNYCCCQEVFAAAPTFKNTTGIHFAEKWKVKWTDMCADSSFLLWKWILPGACDKSKALMLRKMQQNKSVQWGRKGTLFVSAFRFIWLYSQSCCFFSYSSITLKKILNGIYVLSFKRDWNIYLRFKYSSNLILYIVHSEDVFGRILKDNSPSENN